MTVPLRFQEAIVGRTAGFEDGQIYQQPGRCILQAVKGLEVTMPGWFRDAVLVVYGRKGVECAGNGDVVAENRTRSILQVGSFPSRRPMPKS